VDTADFAHFWIQQQTGRPKGVKRQDGEGERAAGQSRQTVSICCRGSGRCRCSPSEARRVTYIRHGASSTGPDSDKTCLARTGRQTLTDTRTHYTILSGGRASGPEPCRLARFAAPVAVLRSAISVNRTGARFSKNLMTNL